MLIVHKCLYEIAPPALSNLLTYSSSTRMLKLNQKRCNSTTYGDQAFSVAAPKIWNLLPIHVRMKKDVAKFKALLKTFLFKESETFLEDKRTIDTLYIFYIHISILQCTAGQATRYFILMSCRSCG